MKQKTVGAFLAREKSVSDSREIQGDTHNSVKQKWTVMGGPGDKAGLQSGPWRIPLISVYGPPVE